MGVIQDHAIGRVRLQQFDAPRHGAHVLQPAADGLGAHAQAQTQTPAASRAL